MNGSAATVRWITFFGVVLCCLLPTAAAVDPPSPAPTLIIDLLDYTANSTSATWNSRVNITFEVPNGFDSTWTWYLNLTPDVSLCPDNYCYKNELFPITTISARNGWATGQFSFIGLESVDPVSMQPRQISSLWAFRNATIHAVNGTTVGTPSCTIGMNFQQFDTGFLIHGGDGAVDTLHHKIPNEAGIVPYYACGSNMTIADPTGVQAEVFDDYVSGNGTSTTNISWVQSVDDENFSMLDYYVLRRYNNPPHPDSTLFWNRDSPTDGLDNATLHSHLIVGSGTNGTRDNVWVQVLARDNLTHQRSVGSCVVNVIQGVAGSAAGCGSLSAFRARVPTAPTPSFPGLNVSAWTSATGLASDAAGWVLAAFLVLCLAFGGFMIARGWGAGIAGALGLGWSYNLGLTQAWIIIVVFALATVVVVLMYDRGGGGVGGGQGGKK